MITPYFKCDQDERFIIVQCQLKYVKISEVDFFVEDNNFKMHLKPYFLNLYFSDKLRNSDNCISQYDFEKGILICKVEKETPGTEFKDLDKLSFLLESNENAKKITKKIEAVGEDVSNIDNLEDSNENKLSKINLSTAKDLNSLLYEETFEQFKNISLVGKDKGDYSYGFNNEYTKVFDKREEELFELADLNPDIINCRARFSYKITKENKDFVPERYLCDTYDSEEADEIVKLSIEKYIESLLGNTMDIDGKSLDIGYTEKEFSILTSLKKVQLNIFSEDVNIHLYIQILDILLAYLYDLRTNNFESSSESGWAINKISSVLSCFCDYKDVNLLPEEDILEKNRPIVQSSLKCMLVSFYRRVLCYPIYRNFEICDQTKRDLIKVYKKVGVKGVLKMMMGVKAIFERSEPRYMLNQIYIDHYIKFIQISHGKLWDLLIDLIEKESLAKFDINLSLENLDDEFLNCDNGEEGVYEADK